MSLPSGYKRLEYIQSSGTQYVDTNVVPSLNHGFKVRFQPSDLNGDNIYIGCATSGSQYWGGETYNAEHAYMWNRGATVSGTVFVGQTYTTSLNYKNDRKFIVDGVVAASLSAVSITNTPIRIFGFNNGSTSFLFRGKIFGVEITFNDEVICDFIPCQKPDGTIGLWDDVNSVFYGNAGTGTFTAGKVMAVAADLSETIELEYIQSSETQYIDTGFKPNQDTRLVMDVDTGSSWSTEFPALFGVGSTSGGGSSDKFLTYLYKSISGVHDHYAAQTKNSSTVNMFGRHTVDKNKNITTIDGVTVSQFTYAAFQQASQLALFCCLDGGSYTGLMAMKLYSCQIYDNGTIVRDYVAAKLTDGTVGLYDKLNGLLYINEGTGTFEAGPVKEPPSAPATLQHLLAVRLAWSAVDGAYSYNIYRDGTLLGRITETSFVDTTAAENQEYTYAVSAVGSGGESAKTTLTVYTKSGYFLYKPYVESATFQ